MPDNIEARHSSSSLAFSLVDADGHVYLDDVTDFSSGCDTPDRVHHAAPSPLGDPHRVFANPLVPSSPNDSEASSVTDDWGVVTETPPLVGGHTYTNDAWQPDASHEDEPDTAVPMDNALPPSQPPPQPPASRLPRPPPATAGADSKPTPRTPTPRPPTASRIPRAPTPSPPAIDPPPSNARNDSTSTLAIDPPPSNARNDSTSPPTARPSSAAQRNLAARVAAERKVAALTVQLADRTRRMEQLEAALKQLELELVASSDTLGTLRNTKRGDPHLAQRAVLAACGAAGQVRDVFQEALASKSAALVAAMHAHEAASEEAQALQEARYATLHRLAHAHASTVDQLHHAVSHGHEGDVWAPLQRLQLFDEFLRWRRLGRRGLPARKGRDKNTAAAESTLEGRVLAPRQRRPEHATAPSEAAAPAVEPSVCEAAEPTSELRRLQSELDDHVAAMELLRTAHAARQRASTTALAASEAARAAAEQRAAALKRSLSQLAATHRALKQAHTSATQQTCEMQAAQRGREARLRTKLQQALALVRTASL